MKILLTLLFVFAAYSLVFSQVDTSDHKKISKELQKIIDDTIPKPSSPSKGVTKGMLDMPQSEAKPEATPERVEAEPVPGAEIIIDRPLDPNKKTKTKTKSKQNEAPPVIDNKKKTDESKNKNE
ncbi:MAG: hypothetical protein N2449_02340 [Bacteroidales bacterium]|nr:hypothetical protein [Bacteroidales bacterium]